jgi:hypothetical protein
MRRTLRDAVLLVGSILPALGCAGSTATVERAPSSALAPEGPEAPEAARLRLLRPFSLVQAQFAEQARLDNAQTFSGLRNHMSAALDSWPVALRPLDFELEGKLPDWSVLQQFEGWEALARAFAGEIPGATPGQVALYRYCSQWRRDSYALEMGRMGLWSELDPAPQRWDELAQRVREWRDRGGLELQKALLPRERFISALLPSCIEYDGALQELRIQLLILGNGGIDAKMLAELKGFVERMLSVAEQLAAIDTPFESFEKYLREARRLALSAAKELIRVKRLAGRSRELIALRDRVDELLGPEAKERPRQR